MNLVFCPEKAENTAHALSKGGNNFCLEHGCHSSGTSCLAPFEVGLWALLGPLQCKPDIEVVAMQVVV